MYNEKVTLEAINLIINISDLLKGINVDTMDISFYEDIDNITICGKNIKILEPMKVTGKITTDGKIASFSGQANLTIQTECDRCVSVFEENLTFDINEKFTNDSYSDDENEYYQMIDNKIDFTPVIMHNLHMNMPMKFLCSSDCKGIVTNCETNINECSPFAKLKETFKTQGGR